MRSLLGPSGLLGPAADSARAARLLAERYGLAPPTVRETSNPSRISSGLDGAFLAVTLFPLFGFACVLTPPAWLK